MAVIAVDGRDRPVYWGTFTACESGPRGSGTNSGRRVSDDETISPHHNPSEYHQSTSNPKHLPPTSIAKIGHTDQVNHQYDLTDFDAALKAGNLPSVSFLQAGEYQDGHAGYSDLIDEQHFLVNTGNELQESKDWRPPSAARPHHRGSHRTLTLRTTRLRAGRRRRPASRPRGRARPARSGRSSSFPLFRRGEDGLCKWPGPA
jgi:hypothetical protein